MRGRYCVFDLESRPDPDAVALLQTEGRNAMQRSALHHVVAASILEVEFIDGAWRGWSLRSLHRDTTDEPSMLASCESALGKLGDGTLVTFGGTHHDLPVLRNRCLATFRFGSTILADGPWRHRDLMREWRGPGELKFSSLHDLCAALGIRLEPDRVSSVRLVEPPTVRKSQVDVVGTFLLLLYRLSLEQRSIIPLATGWRDLADFLNSGPTRAAPHLAAVASHPFVAVARDNAP